MLSQIYLKVVCFGIPRNADPEGRLVQDNNQSYVKVTTIAECCAECAARGWCQHFSLTYSSMDCFMKGGSRSLTPAAGVTAGFCDKRSAGPPAPPAPPPGPLLPLDKTKVKKVAVLGPNGGGTNAAQMQLGQYLLRQIFLLTLSPFDQQTYLPEQVRMHSRHRAGGYGGAGHP